MFQWLYNDSQYNDSYATFPITFSVKTLFAVGTKCHNSTQFLALDDITATGVTVHCSQAGSYHIFVGGY